MNSRFAGLAVVAALVALTATLAALALPSSAAVSVGHSGWYWGNPVPQGNDLRAVELFGTRGYAAGSFGTVLRTDDAGATWAGLPSGTTTDLTDLQVLDADTLIAGGGCALRRSDDGGRSFKRLPFTASDLRCSASVSSFHFPAEATGYLLLGDGTVLQTPDGGNSFAQRTAVPGTAATGSGSDTPTDLFFTGPQTGIAVTSGPQAGGRIFRTTDGAGSWTLVSSQGNGLNGVHFPTPATGYAVGNANAMLETADGGATWAAKPLAGAPAGNALTDIRCADVTTCLISTTGGERLLRTTDGGDTGASISPSTRKVFAAAFSSAARAVAVGLGGTTVASDTAGATFAPVGGRLAGAFGRLRAVSASTAYAAGRDGRVARTVDGGKSWTPIGVSTADDVRDVSFPTLSIGFALDSSGTALRTDNGGTTWRILNTGTTARPQSVLALDSRRVLLIGPRGIRRSTNGGEQFSAVRSRAIRNATLFDVDRAGGAIFVYGTQRLAVSTNGGSAWRAVGLPRGRGISEVDFTTPRAGYLLQQSGRLFTTRNGGRKWTEVLSLGSNSGAYMAFGTTRNGFVAADVADPAGAGVLRTTDGGRSWQPQLITPQPLTDLAAAGANGGFALEDRGENRLFGTDSGGAAGTLSRLSLKASARRVRRGGRVRITGRLRPAQGGEFVVVARRTGKSWVRRPVRVASNGAFTATFKLRSTSRFVAQWRGDDARRGDGTPALAVVVGARRRR